MNEQSPSFMRRVGLAFSVFLRILFDALFAGKLVQLLSGGPEQASPPAAIAEPMLKDTAPDAALQLLGMLQQQGRLVDFLEENIAEYSDAEIGAAVRVVHDGCRKTLREHFTLVPIRREAEGARVTLQAGFDASAVRLTGNLVGEAPFTGTLAHRGWRVTDVRLPQLARGHDVQVIAAAEVEL